MGAAVMSTGGGNVVSVVMETQLGPLGVAAAPKVELGIWRRPQVAKTAELAQNATFRRQSIIISAAAGE